MTSSIELVHSWSFRTCHFWLTVQVLGFSYVWSLSNLWKTKFLLSHVTMTSSNDLLDVWSFCTCYFCSTVQLCESSYVWSLCKLTLFLKVRETAYSKNCGKNRLRCFGTQAKNTFFGQKNNVCILISSSAYGPSV